MSRRKMIRKDEVQTLTCMEMEEDMGFISVLGSKQGEMLAVLLYGQVVSATAAFWVRTCAHWFSLQCPYRGRAAVYVSGTSLFPIQV